jgi:hypothetical protein
LLRASPCFDLAFSGPSQQQLPLRFISCQRCCALEFLSRFRKPIELNEQIRANTRQQMVTLEQRLAPQLVDDAQSLFGPLRHPDRDGSVQLDHGRWDELGELTIQLDNPGPVGFTSRSRPSVTGGDCCLQPVRPERT